MQLTPSDVQDQQFHDAWRGYNQEEVDDFLDRVAETIEQLARENQSMRQRVKELDEKVVSSRHTEDMLKQTLITAQKAAEEAIATAKSKADELIAEAERRSKLAGEEARQRITTAEKEQQTRFASGEREQQTRLAAIEKQHADKRKELEESLSKLQAFEAELRLRLKSFLDQQQKALTAMSQANTRPPGVAAPSSTPAPATAPAPSAAPQPSARPPAQVSGGANPQATQAPAPRPIAAASHPAGTGLIDAGPRHQAPSTPAETEPKAPSDEVVEEPEGQTRRGIRGILGGRE